MRKFASPRQSCRNGRGGRRISTRCLPVLYLRGVSTGDFQEALAALLGGLSPGAVPPSAQRRTRCPCSQNERSPGHSPAAFRAVCGLVLKPVPRIGGLAFRLIE